MVRSGTEQFITDNLPADDGFLWVTDIIDTVMATVLTEMMAFWYKEMPWQSLSMVIPLTLSLALARVVAVRYSPRSHRADL